MSLHITLGVIISLVFHCASAQFGLCSSTDFNQFVTGLPNSCGSTVYTVLDPSHSTSEQLDAALATFCHVSCGEVVVDYLLECHSVGIAFALNNYCIPTRNTSGLGNYCQHSLPGRIDVSIINMLASCNDFSVSGTCNGACAVGLTAVRNAVGCCYQNVYNNTDVLNGYFQAQLISQDNFVLFTNIISNYSLWSECGVSQVDQCRGYPFPGRSTDGGVCTNEQIDEHMATLSEACQAFVRNVLLNLNSGFPVSQMTLNIFCTSECGGSVSDFQSSTCRNEFLSTLTQEVCLKTDGTVGNHCYFALNRPTVDQILTDLAICLTSSPGICPSGCAAALQAISSRMGCCYQNIYNNTQFLDAFLVFQNDFTIESITFFKVLSNYRLWDICGVPLTKRCQGEPFSDNAFKFTAGPVTVWVIVQAVIMLLY